MPAAFRTLGTLGWRACSLLPALFFHGLESFRDLLVVCAVLLGFCVMPQGAGAGVIHGEVIDAVEKDPVAGAVVRAAADSSGRDGPAVQTDGRGRFSLRVKGVRPCTLRVDAFGYERAVRRLPAGDTVDVVVALRPRPLRMDEVVVRGVPTREAESGPAFVEVIAVDRERAVVDLPQLLDGALGVNVRSNGGLGSFSTVSIRGSTAEQVQVYLDGVPLNQALGGGVDMGDVAVEGIDRIEVYRGAIPSRFGGNSMGGVIHLRTRPLREGSRARISATTGAWGTRKLSGSVEWSWGGRRILALAGFAHSDNDFYFRDDNGTEYNPNDDRDAHRKNDDYTCLHTLVKADQRLGQARLQIRNVAEIRHQGIPSISNNQSLSTRLDRWRSNTEVELFGAFPGWNAAGFRSSFFHVVQQLEYKDLQSTVGLGRQHDRNTTTTWGGRAELDAALGEGGTGTLFLSAERQRFAPHSLLASAARLPSSLRRSATVGGETEIPLWRNLLRLSAGSQCQVIQDRFHGDVLFSKRAAGPERRHTRTLVTARLGGIMALGSDLRLKGHRGWYRRAPGFYELFGDRGAVAGNTDLCDERGGQWDLGLTWGRPARSIGPLRQLEGVYFDHHVHELIRFMQNSQRVSIPHNIGSAHIRGVEVRALAQLHSRWTLHANYAYQVAENLTRASYEHGRDLPNTPRHTLSVNLGWAHGRWELTGEVHRESRHYLDRANLRSVPARTIVGAALLYRPVAGFHVCLEVRNLTDDRLADQWGYPLPGRSAFLSFTRGLGDTSR